MLQKHTKCSVGAASSLAFTCVDTLEGIKRKEPVSIGELNAFISNSDEQDPNGEGDELPRCLEELAGKEFVFQIRVTPFNFTPNHRTFTVSTITEYNTLETCGKEHDDNILPNREAEVTLAASSSGQSVLGNRTGVEYAEANPPEVEGAQKKRKLSSE
uniref:Uncharacterized protein n=1 Tax=Brassica oleracea var. oleracea TaxID=109376 RepID=A0A0D3AUV7_BRAOL